MAGTTKTTKRVVKKPTVRKATPKTKVADKPIEVIVVPKSPSGWMDKAFDLVKWVDSPFKLVTVIILGLSGLVGYVAYKQQDLIVSNLTSKDKMQILLADEQKADVPQSSIQDLKEYFDIMDKTIESITVE